MISTARRQKPSYGKGFIRVQTLSRKFVYQQTHKAVAALDGAFLSATPDHEVPGLSHMEFSSPQTRSEGRFSAPVVEFGPPRRLRSTQTRPQRIKCDSPVGDPHRAALSALQDWGCSPARQGQ